MKPVVWCDVETTGLDPQSGYLLEVALLFDDYSSPRDEISVILRPEANARAACTGEVLSMHRESGLWKDSEDHGVDLVEAQKTLLAWWDARVALTTPAEGAPLLGGCGPHFDRRWLREFMPLLETRFHYRHLDVRVLREVFPNASPTVSERVEHRALPDAQYAREVWQWFRARLKLELRTGE